MYTTQSPRPSNRSGHTAVLDGNFMYIFGGSNVINDKLNDLWRLNLTEHTWEEIAK